MLAVQDIIVLLNKYLIPTLKSNHAVSSSFSYYPSSQPSYQPSISTEPSSQPSDHPSISTEPTSQPSLNPSLSANPSSQPSQKPSSSLAPSCTVVRERVPNPCPGDPFLAGAPVRLVVERAVLYETVTGDDGYYEFSCVPERYSIEIDLPECPSLNPSVSVFPSFHPSETPSSSNHPSSIPTQIPSLSSAPSCTVVRERVPNPCPGDPFLAGAPVRLVVERAVLYETVTGDDGYYEFSCVPERYSIEIDLPECPSFQPSMQPTVTVSHRPSAHPSSQNSIKPSETTSLQPSISYAPSSTPSVLQSVSSQPSLKGTQGPSVSTAPSGRPSLHATTSRSPSLLPSVSPSISSNPSHSLTQRPSTSTAPSIEPTSRPSLSGVPTSAPSYPPSISNIPSLMPTMIPSVSPRPTSLWDRPSLYRDGLPSSSPSTAPTVVPTSAPIVEGSFAPTPFDGTIRGCEADPCDASGQSSLVGAVVRLYVGRTVLLATVTDEYGCYEFTGLTRDRSFYDIVVELPECPSFQPSSQPTTSSFSPSGLPSFSTLPSTQSSSMPTRITSLQPSISSAPSSMPSSFPTISTKPSLQGTQGPSVSTAPSDRPSLRATASSSPSSMPSVSPSMSSNPSHSLTQRPSTSTAPSIEPTSRPSLSGVPTSAPSYPPSISQMPTMIPSVSPSMLPSGNPSRYRISDKPSVSAKPTSLWDRPSLYRDGLPSSSPSMSPSTPPSNTPSEVPTAIPTSSPFERGQLDQNPSVPTSVPTSSAPTTFDGTIRGCVADPCDSSGDSFLVGAIVNLYVGSSVLDETLTDENGCYEFTGLTRDRSFYDIVVDYGDCGRRDLTNEESVTDEHVKLFYKVDDYCDSIVVDGDAGGLADFDTLDECCATSFWYDMEGCLERSRIAEFQPLTAFDGKLSLVSVLAEFQPIHTDVPRFYPTYISGQLCHSKSSFDSWEQSHETLKDCCEALFSWDYDACCNSSNMGGC